MTKTGFSCIHVKKALKRGCTVTCFYYCGSKEVDPFKCYVNCDRFVERNPIINRQKRGKLESYLL